VKKQSKKRYEVAENESIDHCLERMHKDGYMPVRRMEEPIFEEVTVNGQTEVQPCGRKIIFEGKLL
jgi:hypothetical protein